MKGRTKYEGFFSVEAALILPMVLGVYLFLIVILFLQYDRCLLEQDMASLMLKAGNYEGTPQQRMAFLQEEAAKWDRQQYLWVTPQAPYFVVRGSQIRLEAAGEYRIPILGISTDIGGTHRLEVTYQLTAWDREALVQALSEKDSQLPAGRGKIKGEDEKENE